MPDGGVGRLHRVQHVVHRLLVRNGDLLVPNPGDAVVDLGLGLADDGIEVGGADDGVVVIADVAAVVGQHLRLVREDVGLES